MGVTDSLVEPIEHDPAVVLDAALLADAGETGDGDDEEPLDFEKEAAAITVVDERVG